MELVKDEAPKERTLNDVAQEFNKKACLFGTKKYLIDIRLKEIAALDKEADALLADMYILSIEGDALTKKLREKAPEAVAPVETPEPITT